MSDYPPRWGKPSPVKTRPSRFSVTHSLDAYEVIDHDGRPVAVRERSRDAEVVASRLNEAAYSGTGDLTLELETLSG